MTKPDPDKGFHDPELGWIVGYDSPEEFNAAVAAYDDAHKDDPPFAGEDPAWWAARGLPMPSLDWEDE